MLRRKRPEGLLHGARMEVFRQGCKMANMGEEKGMANYRLWEGGQ